MDTKPRALVLGSGGGTRGALYPRVLTRLWNELDIRGMVGNSINAVQAYALCTGNAADLEPTWRELKGQSGFMARNNPLNGLHGLGPLRKLMAEKRYGLPQISMRVGVFWWARAEHRLEQCQYRPLEDVLDLVIASASIAGVHDVFQFGGRHAGDGGHHMALPLVPDDEYFRYDEVHALFCRPLDGILPALEERDVNGPIEQITRFIDYQVGIGVRHTLERLKRLAASHRGTTDFYVYAPGDWETTGPTFERNNKRFRELTERRLEHGDAIYEHRVKL